MSIFLQTRFGQFILEQYHASRPLKPEDESKMNLGLKLIQTRLQAHPESDPLPIKRRRGRHLQYTRLSGKDSIGASVPDIGIPTGPLVETNIKAGASVSTTRNWYEQPGNNTLTYLQAKFNGW